MNHNTVHIIDSQVLFEGLCLRTPAGNIGFSRRLHDYYSVRGDVRMGRKYDSIMVMQGDVEMC